ncbi:MAG: hypothetical protein JXA33_26905, partial [Anaerolineae bacterium]|nr:hypothetical protein [Anaerolineae bacterium]
FITGLPEARLSGRGVVARALTPALVVSLYLHVSADFVVHLLRFKSLKYRAQCRFSRHQFGCRKQAESGKR